MLHPMVWGTSANSLALVLKAIDLFLPCKSILWKSYQSWYPPNFPKLISQLWGIPQPQYVITLLLDPHWTYFWKHYLCYNKANLRDLIAATGLVISNWIQIVNFSARVTVKFDGWPCKTIGHLFYATSSFVHLFVPIGEFKLKFQSGNAQSWSNWMIFRAVRPWNLTDDLAKQ